MPLSCHASSSSSRQSTESFAALDLASGPGARLFHSCAAHARSPFLGGGVWRLVPPALPACLMGPLSTQRPSSSLQASSATGSNTVATDEAEQSIIAAASCACLLSIESRITLPPRPAHEFDDSLAGCVVARRGEASCFARMWACLSPQQPDLAGRGRCPNIARGTERGCGPERARSHRPGAHGRHSHTAAAAASAHTQRRRRQRDESC